MATNRFLIIALIIASFFIGSLTNKVATLEKNGASGSGVQGAATAPQQPTTSIADTFISYAKQAGLDEKKFSACFNKSKYKQNVLDDLSQGEKVGVRGTPAFFINGIFLGGAFPIESFKEIIDRELNGTSSTNYLDYSKTLQDAYNQQAFDPTPKTVELGNAPIQGEKNAKITIIEFSDFQCPYCERVFPTVQQLMKDYNGKVQLAYKQFPLGVHPNAQKSAEASECANEQGKFWEYHDLLFKNQAIWSPLAPITN